MVECTLPANSKVGPGKTHAAPAGAANASATNAQATNTKAIFEAKRIR